MYLVFLRNEIGTLMSGNEPLVLELMDFSIQSGKWRGKLKEILRARDQIAEYYISIPKNTENLQKMLKFPPHFATVRVKCI